MNDLNFDNPAVFRNGIMILLLAAFALIVHNVFSQNGYMTSRRQKKEIQTLQQNIQQLKQENAQLDKENRALKSDPAAIEAQARGGLHLVKPGEKDYVLPATPANPPTPAAKETSP
jgi:cell division protein FtsL